MSQTEHLQHLSRLQKNLKHEDREMVPRALVRAMAALLLTITALVTYAQVTGMPNTGVLQEAPIVASRDITLIGSRTGVYRVEDGAGAQIAVSSENRAGFIGVIGRSLDRARLTQNIAGNPPVQVVRRDNGHIAVIDDSTGQVIELIGYGQDNVAAFARLLD